MPSLLSGERFSHIFFCSIAFQVLASFSVRIRYVFGTIFIIKQILDDWLVKRLESFKKLIFNPLLVCSSGPVIQALLYSV